MPRDIILLTGRREAPHLGGHLRRFNPELKIRTAFTKSDLARAAAAADEEVRLISFTSEVIVPSDILDGLALTPYNFHPGPPTHPGVYSESFALYYGTKRFGATVHEMTPEIDAGPIVGVEWFDIPEGCRRMQLAGMAYEALVNLFSHFAQFLATANDPLPKIEAEWSGKPTRRKDFQTMCDLPTDIDAAEFERRFRCFGEGPDNALTITLHGHKFRIENDWQDEYD